MKEYKVWFKFLAVILSVLIGFQVAPVFAVALENGQSTSSTTKLVKPKTSSAPKKNTVSEDVLLALADKDDEQEAEAEKAPDITGEETELRDAGVKHFRLSDGRYMAAIYPEPVHYEKDGEWVDINNTLREAKAEDGTVRYAATETSTPVSFPDRLAKNDGTAAPITVNVRGHELKMTAESTDPTTDSVASVVEPNFR